MKKSQRGFLEYGGFEDEWRVKIRVSESSAADRPRWWLWLDDDDSAYEEKGKGKEIGAHLSAKDINRLIKILQKALTKHRLK